MIPSLQTGISQYLENLRENNGHTESSARRQTTRIFYSFIYSFIQQTVIVRLLCTKTIPGPGYFYEQNWPKPIFS